MDLDLIKQKLIGKILCTIIQYNENSKIHIAVHKNKPETSYCDIITSIDIRIPSDVVDENFKFYKIMGFDLKDRRKIHILNVALKDITSLITNHYFHNQENYDLVSYFLL